VISNSLYPGATREFSVREDGEEVKYEVETKGRWQEYNKYIIIKRNGIIIFNGK